MDSDIFVKSNKKLNYKKILETIPPNNYKIPQIDKLKKGLIEWRWRFIQLVGSKLVVEISHYDLKSKTRFYLKESGNWVKRDIPKEYDKFVIKKYYYYSLN